MDDHQGEERSEIARAWDTVRRVREPIAWTLLAITAIIVLVSACQLFNLAGAKIPVSSPAPVAVRSAAPVQVGSSPAPPAPANPSSAPSPVGPSPVQVSAFAPRASAVAPQFIDAAVQAMPVLAV